MVKRVAIIGAGSWGTTVATLIAEKVPTVLWARDEKVVSGLLSNSRNDRYLPDFELPKSLYATSDLSEAVSEADLLFLAIPTHGLRLTVEEIANCIKGVPSIISLTKGFELGTHLRMTQIIQSIMPDNDIGVLTGPNIAKEILEGRSAASVVASKNFDLALQLQELLSSDRFRVYTNHDLVGCEVGGAVKNVVALAAGMAQGLEAGDNARAALITRGLAELARIGEALGGEAQTFAGLAGMGDVLTTCMSPHSRNRWVGEQVGRGRDLEVLLGEMRQAVEGIPTVKVVCELAQETNIEAPISKGVYRVFHQKVKPRVVWEQLMSRESKTEL